ncbi:hypothetical protein MPH_07829 [Macrophomina phaseolina MS6]|uniref:Uncharacterized protein n=1 Tax=Macrophomina phaseolina (strain MS6) TaxID=1126212 RepID=K2RXI4_MACPH|nr:hypothetical protein MPH_07829 [Macrophomina phaseolina MS6]
MLDASSVGHITRQPGYSRSLTQADAFPSRWTNHRHAINTENVRRAATRPSCFAALSISSIPRFTGRIAQYQSWYKVLQQSLSRLRSHEETIFLQRWLHRDITGIKSALPLHHLCMFAAKIIKSPTTTLVDIIFQFALKMIFVHDGSILGNEEPPHLQTSACASDPPSPCLSVFHDCPDPIPAASPAAAVARVYLGALEAWDAPRDPHHHRQTTIPARHRSRRMGQPGCNERNLGSRGSLEPSDRYSAPFAKTIRGPEEWNKASKSLWDRVDSGRCRRPSLRQNTLPAEVEESEKKRPHGPPPTGSHPRQNGSESCPVGVGVGRLFGLA